MSKTPLKVLLADDVRLELEIEKTFFQRSGFLVLTANDGLSALALTLSELPDLVILDQVMPGMTGSQVCKELKQREETRAIPVLIISSNENQEVVSACYAAGADGFLAKSEGKDALLKRAARILRVPERKTTRLTVCFTVEGVPGAKETLGKAVELSEGGMGLETSKLYQKGTLFQLRFIIPGEKENFRVGAKVVGANEKSDGVAAIALEFTEISEMDRLRLNHYIDVSLSRR